MIVRIVSSKNYDDADCEDMFIDDKEAMSVYPLNECPEDAYIGRSLVSCYDVFHLMHKAWLAAKAGEELGLVEEEEKP